MEARVIIQWVLVLICCLVFAASLFTQWFDKSSKTQVEKERLMEIARKERLANSQIRIKQPKPENRETTLHKRNIQLCAKYPDQPELWMEQ